MKKCKYCEAELENSTVCPQCGKDNAETDAEVPAEDVTEAPAAEVTEVPAAEEAEKQKLSTGKSILAIAALAVVVILLFAVVLNSQKRAEVEEPTSVDEIVETVAPTIPTDGNPEDVTCKGTYYADDETVIAARDTVIATAGDRELTLGQLQVFYWMEVRNFLSQYGAYAAYFGLDIQQSLDTQVCGVMDTPMTWQQYFLDSALNAWVNYSAMSAEADASGFVLTQEQQATLDSITADLGTAATQNGFSSAEEMIHSSLGSAAEIEDYAFFMEGFLKANGYYNQMADSVTYTEEALEAYYDEHADGYAQAGITRDGKYVDVRHILVYPEGADGTNIFTEEFPEEAWNAGEAAAQEILDTWMAGDQTEESFAALANEHSQDPGSNTNGGLYENVTEGEMVQAFNDWCFDAERQVGDTGVVRTEYGFHVMYFSGSRLMWKEYAESDFISENINGQVAEIIEKNPVEFRYADMLLCNLNLT